MTKAARIAALALALLVVLLPSMAAQDDGRATVTLDGRAPFRLGAGEDPDAAVRARRVGARLAGLLQEAAELPRRAELRPRGEVLAVIVSGVPVVIALLDDAGEAGRPLDELAARISGDAPPTLTLCTFAP